jgi:hypothetical protein
LVEFLKSNETLGFLFGNRDDSAFSHDPSEVVTGSDESTYRLSAGPSTSPARYFDIATVPSK